MKQVRLPNGVLINALNRSEADVLYHEIFAMQSYQQHGITIADGNCIFDVGANIGLYSFFLTQTHTSLRLFAFEPIPDLFAVLQQNAQTLFHADWPKIRQFIIEVHDLDNRVNTLVNLFTQRGFKTIVDQEYWALHKLMNIYTLYAIAHQL